MEKRKVRPRCNLHKTSSHTSIWEEKRKEMGMVAQGLGLACVVSVRNAHAISQANRAT